MAAQAPALCLQRRRFETPKIDARGWAWLGLKSDKDFHSLFLVRCNVRFKTIRGELVLDVVVAAIA